MRKIIFGLFLVLFLSSPAWAVTQLKHTVCPAGGGCDFTTLYDAVAHLKSTHPDLVSADVYADIEISGDWTGVTPESQNIIVSGITTDSSHYINIYTTTEARHRGYYDTARYRIEITAENYSPWFGTWNNYTRVTGLQGYNSDTNGGRGFFMGDETTTGGVFDKIISRARRYGGAQISYSGTTSVIKNSIFISYGDYDNDGLDLGGSYGTVNVYNCIGISLAGSGNGITADLTDNNKHIYNSYGYSAAGDDISSNLCPGGGGSNNTITTSASPDGSCSTTVAAYSTSSGAYFQSVTTGSENFTITTDSALKDAGTDESGAGVTDDITGVSRPQGSDFDIGPFELIVSGGTPRRRMAVTQQ